MKRTRRALLAALLALLLLTACGPRPAHERIAGDMRRAYADPRLNYCVEKYGDELTVSDTGDVRSTRFGGMQVYLQWDEEEGTYKDSYLVYLREEELLSLLTPIAATAFDEYKLCLSPYLVCPSSFDRDTTAEELLHVTALDDSAYGPAVQTFVYTTADPVNRELDMAALRDALWAEDYALRVYLCYVTAESFAQVSREAHRNGALLNLPYRCRLAFTIEPDEFCLSRTFYRCGEEAEASESEE